MENRINASEEMYVRPAFPAGFMPPGYFFSMPVTEYINQTVVLWHVDFFDLPRERFTVKIGYTQYFCSFDG